MRTNIKKVALESIGQTSSKDEAYRIGAGMLNLFGKAFFGHKKTRKEARQLNTLWNYILSF